MSIYHHLQEATAADRDALLSSPVIAAALTGHVTRLHYLDFLSRAYHHVSQTVPLLMACGARLPAHQEWLRAEVARYVEEEIGHHEWVLDDIAAAGGDADAVRASKPDRDTDIMVAYAWDTVLRRNPVGMFGMVYVLEGTSVRLASQAADRLFSALALPPLAFTYLRSHGSLDLEHLGHFEALVNRFDAPADRDSLVASAKAFFHLYANVLRGIDVGGRP